MYRNGLRTRIVELLGELVVGSARAPAAGSAPTARASTRGASTSAPVAAVAAVAAIPAAAATRAHPHFRFLNGFEKISGTFDFELNPLLGT